MLSVFCKRVSKQLPYLQSCGKQLAHHILGTLSAGSLLRTKVDWVQGQKGVYICDGDCEREEEKELDQNIGEELVEVALWSHRPHFHSSHAFGLLS